MNIRYLLVVMFGLLCGCSHSSSSSGPKNVDLGTVNLTYDTASKHDIGDGRTFVVTARPLGNQAELLAEIEKSGKVLETLRVLPAALDQTNEFNFPDLKVTLTPHVGQ